MAGTESVPEDDEGVDSAENPLGARTQGGREEGLGRNAAGQRSKRRRRDRGSVEGRVIRPGAGVVASSRSEEACIALRELSGYTAPGRAKQNSVAAWCA